MDPNHRITKDTSARKNTMSAGVHTAIETAAMMASREAYINSIIQGYQEKIATMESEQQNVVDEAVKKALATSASQMNELEEMIAQQKRAIASVDGELRATRAENENIRSSHASQVKKLQKQLQVGPNSWVEFHVTGKGRKKRTYVRRPNASFTLALADLGKHTDSMRFKFDGTTILGNETRTLQQMGVKDGDTLEIL